MIHTLEIFCFSLICLISLCNIIVIFIARIICLSAVKEKKRTPKTREEFLRQVIFYVIANQKEFSFIFLFGRNGVYLYNLMLLQNINTNAFKNEIYCCFVIIGGWRNMLNK